MTDVCCRESAIGAADRQSRNAGSRGIADLLGFAAAPTFAIMAVLTCIGDGGAICAAASPLNGMAAMYGLMSAFHISPWLKLITRRHGSPN